MDFWYISALFAVLTGTAFDGTYAQGGMPHSGSIRQFRDGDILIGGALEIHRHPDTGACGELRRKGVQDVETVNMLIERINANNSILRGIKLGSVLIDTCAWPTHAVQQIVKEIIPFVYTFGNSSKPNSKPRILAGVLGAGTSRVSLQMANLLQVFSISQISHSSTSQDLSDKSLYPYFFRTVPPDLHQTWAMVQLAKEMKWNYISVVFDNDCHGRNTYLEFARFAKSENICISQHISMPNTPSDEDYREIVMKLLSKKSKVVIVYTKTTPAENIISITHSITDGKNDLLWVGSDSWSTYLPKNVKDDSYVDALHGAVTFSLYGSHQKSVDEYMTKLKLSDRFGENYDINPWFSELISLENSCALKSDGSSSGKLCQDDDKLDPSLKSYYGLFNVMSAFEAFIQALDIYHRRVCNGRAGFCKELSDLSGTNELAVNLYPILQNISFPLSNGEMFLFDKKQDGPPLYDIMVFNKTFITNPSLQTQGWQLAGKFKNGKISWLNGLPSKAVETESVCSKECEIGQAVIKDQTDVCCWQCIACNVSQFVSPNTSLCENCASGYTSNSYRNGCIPLPIRTMTTSDMNSITFIVFGCVGAVLTIAVTVVYIVYRESPIIKASGRELCFIVLSGMFLTFCNCFALSSPATVLSCVVSRVVLAIGPAIMYAGLLVKTLRVVIIFKYKADLTAKMKTFLHPLPLLMILLGLVSIQIILLIIWCIVYPPIPTVYYDVQFGFQSCPGTTDPMIFMGLVYPFLLILTCTVFATINRHVPTGFNETFLVGFTMYTTCVIWFGFLTLFNVNHSNIRLKITTTSISLSLSALTVLCCLFGPRCFKVFFRPDENTRRAVMSQPRSLELNTLQQQETPSKVINISTIQIDVENDISGVISTS